MDDQGLACPSQPHRSAGRASSASAAGPRPARAARISAARADGPEQVAPHDLAVEPTEGATTARGMSVVSLRTKHGSREPNHVTRWPGVAQLPGASRRPSGLEAGVGLGLEERREAERVEIDGSIHDVERPPGGCRSAVAPRASAARPDAALSARGVPGSPAGRRRALRDEWRASARRCPSAASCRWPLLATAVPL